MLRFFAFLSAVTVILSAVVFFCVRAIVHEPVEGCWGNDDIKTVYTFCKHGELTAKFENAKVPVLEIDYTGELKGEYAVNNKEKIITVSLFYYNKNLTQKYSYEIKNKSLCLKNLEDASTVIFHEIKK